jgi:simple sugar transport system ATP-binding protein
MTRLELIEISKQYPGVKANDRVTLRVAPGEIHAVLGENGAGKSTLMKIIYGAIQPDSGQLVYNGQAVRIAHPEHARRLGIAMVFQHFSLFETLTVAQNVWLGLRDDSTLQSVSKRIVELAGNYGLEIEPTRPVHSLSVGEKQRVEIVRALLTKPQLLILDEPTSVLAPDAVRGLFDLLRKLASEGCSILYISHKLDEIRELCQRCTVLRAGRVTGEVDPSRETNASLSRLMIGAEPARVTRAGHAGGDVLLEVKSLSLPTRDAFGVSLSEVSLEVHTGEIVGIAGVSGNGQRELLALLSGENPGAPIGSLRLLGQDVSRSSPNSRRNLGLRFVPEERLGRASVPSLSLASNTLLTRSEGLGRAGFLWPSRLEALAAQLIAAFAVKARGPVARASSLSGGNLQKFIVGREIDANPKVIVVSQPTWGVDVGAAAHIRTELAKLASGGVGVLVVSDDLDELFELSDSLHVMAGGRLSPRLSRDQASIERVGAWMSGLFDREPLASELVSDVAMQLQSGAGVVSNPRGVALVQTRATP